LHRRLLLSLLLTLLLSSCVVTNSAKSNVSVAMAVEEYFSVYSKRNDFERFMSFYAEDAAFEDIVYGNTFKNKIQIKEFLNWNKGKFELPNGTRALTVTKQVIDNNIAVTEGYFHQFSYNGEKLGPWLFVIIQEFNENKKIISQTDWINYTPRKNFFGGKNMNATILEQSL